MVEYTVKRSTRYHNGKKERVWYTLETLNPPDTFLTVNELSKLAKDLKRGDTVTTIQAPEIAIDGRSIITVTLREPLNQVEMRKFTAEVSKALPGNSQRH